MSSMQKLERGEMLKMVLLGLGALGILSAAIVCPGLLYLVPRSYRGRYPHQAIRQAVVRLDKRGFIVAKQTHLGWKISLTKRGREELAMYELGQKIIKPTEWDKKWRLMIFDIPEHRRVIRDQVRRFLQRLHFVHLQDSVWVYPYECREILDLLRTKYGVRSEALYVRVDALDQDHWLRKEFNVK